MPGVKKPFQQSYSFRLFQRTKSHSPFIENFRSKKYFADCQETQALFILEAAGAAKHFKFYEASSQFHHTTLFRQDSAVHPSKPFTQHLHSI